MTLRTASFPVAAALAAGLVWALALSAGCGRETTGLRSEPTRVLDAAEVLSESQRASIADYLEFVASDRGVDYRVVVEEGAGADLSRRGAATFERLRIGERTEGRGLLLLVDPATREARVEVGYALEPRVRDVEASSMIAEFLAPYFASGQAAAGIEASVERLVDLLEPGRDGASDAGEIAGSGGAGATAELLAGIDRLTPETKARLQGILVPQATPEDCVRLELALMHRGIYYRDAPMYDEAWRRAARPDLPAERLEAIAAEWDGPFAVARAGDRAITYYEGDKSLRWGPQFLRRTDGGWIVDASAVAKLIVYDYSNNAWYAVEEGNPYLDLIRGVYDMKRVSLDQRGAAWMVDSRP